MAEPREFTVGFRGEMTPEQEDAFRRAGFGVYRDGIQTGAVWRGDDPSTAMEFKSRHVLRHVDAPDGETALDRVREILGREPHDPFVAPSQSPD